MLQMRIGDEAVQVYFNPQTVRQMNE